MNRYYKTLIQTEIDFSKAFILRIDTTLGDGLNQMRLPIQSSKSMGIDWGDDVIESVTQTATPTSTNWVTHTYSSAGIYDIKVTNVDIIRFNNEGDKRKPLEVLDWGNYGILQANQNFTFYGCTNLDIADNGAWFDVVTSASRTFQFANFTSLPVNMTLPNLTNGAFMFPVVPLNSLPSGMTLPNLINGKEMFFNNNLNSLPSGMTLENLISGDRMFSRNSLTSLPSAMTLESLTNGFRMFRGSTLNTDALSSLYIKMSVLNPNNNVPFHGGSGFYDPAYTEVINGVTYNTGDARADLVSRGWTLTDGGSV